MVGLRSAVVSACIVIAACSGTDVDLGGGRLLADAAPEDGGGWDWDGSSNWRRSSSRDGDGTGSGNGSDSSGNGSGDGNGSGSSSDGWDPDDAGFEPRCDIDGPYCAPNGDVFPDECDAIRAGVYDSTRCPWAGP